MKFRTLTFLVLFVHGLVLADGLPLNDDRTKCEAPHQLLKLDEDQLEEVTVSRTLTLTRAQWQQARAINPSIPKTISSILSCTYNDCTCGMGNESYGIWFKNGTVAVVFGSTPVMFDKLTTEAKDELTADLNFRLDDRGQFYQGGKLIPYPEVKARVAYLKATPVENTNADLAGLYIDLPPHVKSTDAALAERLVELQKIAKIAGRNFYVMWDMTGLEEPE